MLVPTFIPTILFLFLFLSPRLAMSSSGRHAGKPGKPVRHIAGGGGTEVGLCLLCLVCLLPRIDCNISQGFRFRPGEVIVAIVLATPFFFVCVRVGGVVWCGVCCKSHYLICIMCVLYHV